MASMNRPPCSASFPFSLASCTARGASGGHGRAGGQEVSVVVPLGLALLPTPMLLKRTIGGRLCPHCEVPIPDHVIPREQARMLVKPAPPHGSRAVDRSPYPTAASRSHRRGTSGGSDSSQALPARARAAARGVKRQHKQHARPGGALFLRVRGAGSGHRRTALVANLRHGFPAAEHARLAVVHDRPIAAHGRRGRSALLFLASSQGLRSGAGVAGGRRKCKTYDTAIVVLCQYACAVACMALQLQDRVCAPAPSLPHLARHMPCVVT